MKAHSGKAILLAATLTSVAATSFYCSAQSDAPSKSTQTLSASIDSPKKSGTSTDSAAPASASPAEPLVTKPSLSEAALLREVEDMKARLATLEQALADRSTPASSSSSSSSSTTGAASPETATPVAFSPSSASNPEGLALPSTAKAEAALATQDPNNQNAPAGPAPPIEPFSDSDWSWLNGNPHTKDSPLETKYFSPEFRADAYYSLDFNHPIDDTIGGSSEIFRSQEVQLEQIALGGDVHVDNVRGRILLLSGEFATGTPRNDASPARGQWDLRSAYRYVSEAWGGYHMNVKHGLNVDAGIFVSYIGLFSYYNFDNWAYQPSYVSSNTPWFFEGVRVQYFPTAHLKIEPWFINGWQSYGRFNNKPGLGGQIKWTPKPWLDIISNNYGLGRDDLGYQHRARLHTDNSVEVKYYDQPAKFVDKAAFSLTGDLGCEFGDGVACHGTTKSNSPQATIPGIAQKQSFVGWMGYNRVWFKKDLYGFTFGGGQVNNPGRYLALVLPINGADAVSGTPYFPNADTTQGSTGKSLPFKAWDGSLTFDYMPRQYITMRTEYGYRHSDSPYFAGHGGSTPPGGNNGAPGNFACATGANSGANTLAAAETACGGGIGSVWFPDLRKDEQKLIFSMMVKF